MGVVPVVELVGSMTDMETRGSYSYSLIYFESMSLISRVDILTGLYWCLVYLYLCRYAVDVVGCGEVCASLDTVIDLYFYDYVLLKNIIFYNKSNVKSYLDSVVDVASDNAVACYYSYNNLDQAVVAAAADEDDTENVLTKEYSDSY